MSNMNNSVKQSISTTLNGEEVEQFWFLLKYYESKGMASIHGLLRHIIREHYKVIHSSQVDTSTEGQ